MQGLDVARAEHAEVTVVYRGELGLVEPLDASEDGGGDEADVGVGVLHNLSLIHI